MKPYETIVERWKALPLEKPEDIDYILNDFKVLFAYHSGKIENEEITYDTTLEVFEGKRIVNFTGNYRTLYEIVNQKDCYQYLRKAIIKKRPMTLDFVKEIQRELTKNTYDEVRISKGERPGEFKKGYYVVGKYQIGVAPEEVEPNLKDLLEEINEYQGKDMLRAAAYFHLVFERIHPFSDGNGRVGRTLMNYYLMTHDHPPIVIRESNRKEYVNAFDRFHYDADLNPMVQYLERETVTTWKQWVPELSQPPRRKTLAELEQDIQDQKTEEKQPVQKEPGEPER